ncbi:MAG: hypothetical protein KZQ78_15060 [Candidatus Thiodiazotropha sp. (ex Ustalcina ferruginea)]|nr:hypothetical protein [Candidatus Thiodiazotropha sp. (ex Ustalcina ferruginea)]
MLFTDAARIDLKHLRSDHDLPLRMLVVHGLTALPGVNAYATALKICARRGDDLSSEQQTVTAMPLRLSASLEQGGTIGDD